MNEWNAYTVLWFAAWTLRVGAYAFKSGMFYGQAGVPGSPDLTAKRARGAARLAHAEAAHLCGLVNEPRQYAKVP